MMVAATLASAGIATARARAMFELADRTERLVSLPGLDWYSTLAALGWFVHLPDRPEDTLRPGLILPATVDFNDTAYNLGLLHVGTRIATGTIGPALGAKAERETGVDLLSSQKPPQVGVSICTHDVLLVHRDVAGFHPGVVTKLKAAKVILLGDNSSVAAQAAGLLSTRPRRMELNIPLELILAGAA